MNIEVKKKDYAAETFQQLLKKMENAAAVHRFADLSVTIRLHDGEIRLVEFSIVEKLKPAEIAGGIGHGKKQ